MEGSGGGERQEAGVWVVTDAQCIAWGESEGHLHCVPG